MRVWYSWLGFLWCTVTSPGSAKTVLSTAVLDELELRRNLEPIDIPWPVPVPSNTLFTHDPADILKWNCSETDPSDDPGEAAASEVREARESTAVGRRPGVEDDGRKEEGKKKCVDPFKHEWSKTIKEKLSKLFGNCQTATTTPPPNLEEVQDQFAKNSFILVYQHVLRSTGQLNDTHFNFTTEKNEANAPDEGTGSNQTLNTTKHSDIPVKTVRQTTSEPQNPDAISIKEQDSTNNGNATVIEAMPGPRSTYLLIGEEHGITILDLTYTDRSVIRNLTNLNAYSIDYHFNQKSIFFTAKGQIRSTTHKVASERVDGSVRLAVDWVHDKVYWMSDKYQAVEMAAMDGSNRTVIFHNKINFTYPNNIAVDPYDAYLFFAANNSIMRSSLDGSNLTLLDLHSTKSVDLITADVYGKTIFFSGTTNGTSYLASCDYQGQGVKEVPLTGGPWRVFAMSVFQKTLILGMRLQESQVDSAWRLDLSQPPPLTPQLIYQAPSFIGKMLSIKVYQEGAFRGFNTTNKENL